MLRKYMVLLAPDANTDGASSNPSDANGQGSSPEQQDANGQAPEGETTEDGDTATDDENGDVEDSSDQDTGETGDQQNDQQGQEGQEEPPALTDKPDDTKLEFHKHPRFQELIKEKNTLREEAEGLRQKADRSDILENFMATNGISSQDFANALDILRLQRTDPSQALAALKPIYEHLQMLNGERLPADLESKVAAGMDAETARELARLRAQSQRQQAFQQDNSVLLAQQHEHMIQSAFNSFDTMTRGTDPDFKPKGDPRDPTYGSKPNGLWELTSMEIMRLRAERPPRNTQEALALARDAYQSAKRTVSQFSPRKAPTRRPIGSQNSSTNSNVVIKNSDDVVKALLSGKRPHELRYS